MPSSRAFSHHQRVGDDRFVFGRFEIGADIDDQRRNVIEQAVAREHFVGPDRKQIAQPREPARRQQRVLCGDAIRDRFGKSGRDHATDDYEPCDCQWPGTLPTYAT